MAKLEIRSRVVARSGTLLYRRVAPAFFHATTARFPAGCLLEIGLLINRAVEDFVRDRSLINDVPGVSPFNHLCAAAKRPDHSATGKVVDTALRIGVLKSPPRRETGMTDGDAVADVSRRRHVRRIIEIKGIQFILLPQLPVRRQKVAQFIGFPVWNERRFA